eukprot:scaffold39444_cov16-Tisochrysis_lutea.AAC.1
MSSAACDLSPLLVIDARALNPAEEAPPLAFQAPRLLLFYADASATISGGAVEKKEAGGVQVKKQERQRYQLGWATAWAAIKAQNMPLKTRMRRSWRS